MSSFQLHKTHWQNFSLNHNLWKMHCVPMPTALFITGVGCETTADYINSPSEYHLIKLMDNLSVSVQEDFPCGRRSRRPGPHTSCAATKPIPYRCYSLNGIQATQITCFYLGSKGCFLCCHWKYYAVSNVRQHVDPIQNYCLPDAFRGVLG